MQETKKRIVIVGAASAIAEHCARLWVTEAAVDLILIGRNREKTERVASDLRVRSRGSFIRVVHTDFTDPISIGKAADEIVSGGAIDIVLIAHGMLPDQANCQVDLTACHEALAVNAISPVLFAEAFAGAMQKANKGTLAIIGSVAGDRGRKSNYIYGSAKGLLERYAQGLSHRLAKTRVKVALIKPGPTDTPMTSNLKQKGVKLASVNLVSAEIVKKINQGKSVIYTPIKWAVIMSIIKYMPKFIFNKMEI